MEQHVLLARQPIYRDDLTLHAFELLFRNQNQLNSTDITEEGATYEVLVNYSTGISKEIEHSKHLLFVNVSEGFLLSNAVLPMDKSRVMLELLERIQVSAELIAAVKRLKQKGYRFALDDYDFDDKWDPLLPLVEMIKVDVQYADLNEVQKLKELKSRQFSGTWLAERIEDRDTLDRCKEIGFKFFQGYFLAKPQALVGNSIGGASAITAEVIRLASDPDSDINEISERVAQDPKLSIQLLKLINSPLINLKMEITDLKQAITYLGINMVKRWAMMIAFVANSSTSIESSRIILTRAKCCELYFADANNNSPKHLSSSAFLTGLVSGTDCLLAVDPKQFIQQVNCGQDIQDAILKQEGQLADILEQCKMIEFYLSQSSERLKEIPSELMCHYSEAQDWAGTIIDSLANPT